MKSFLLTLVVFFFCNMTFSKVDLVGYNVYGSSQIRSLTRYEQRNYNAVGLIECGPRNQRIVGTGFLIDLPGYESKYILTAAHILMDENGKKQPQCTIQFLRSRKRHSVNLLISGTKAPYSEHHFDYALAKIKEPVDIDGLSLYDLKVNSEQLRFKKHGFIAIGYHPGRDRMQLSDNCSPIINKSESDIRSNINEEFLHSCSIVQGMSGGPILFEDRRKLKAVCIQSIQINASRTFPGDVFNPLKNPNACVRLSGKVISRIKKAIATDHKL